MLFGWFGLDWFLFLEIVLTVVCIGWSETLGLKWSSSAFHIVVVLAALRMNHSVQQTHVGSLLTGCEKRGARAGLPRKGKWHHFHVTAQETGGWLLRAVNRKNCTEICSVSLSFEFGAVGISAMLFLSTQAHLMIFMPPALWLMVGSSVTRVN